MKAPGIIAESGCEDGDLVLSSVEPTRVLPQNSEKETFSNIVHGTVSSDTQRQVLRNHYSL